MPKRHRVGSSSVIIFTSPYSLFFPSNSVGQATTCYRFIEIKTTTTNRNRQHERYFTTRIYTTHGFFPSTRDFFAKMAKMANEQNSQRNKSIGYIILIYIRHVLQLKLYNSCVCAAGLSLSLSFLYFTAAAALFIYNTPAAMSKYMLHKVLFSLLFILYPLYIHSLHSLLHLFLFSSESITYSSSSCIMQ